MTERTRRTPLLVALALIPALILGAAPAANADLTEGTKDNPAEAAITKALKTPEGTTIPNCTFTFLFASGTRQGTSDQSPAIGDKTVAFTSTSTDDAGTGTTTYREQTDNVLQGVTWPATGVYTYTVTEDPDVTGCALTQDIDEMDNSEAAYTFTVYVAETDGTRYVQYVTAERTTNDAGTGVTDPKTDPKPGDGDDTFSAWEFTNTYIRNNTNNPPGKDDDPGALYLTQTTTGTMADATQPFTLSITVTEPALAGTGDTFTAYLVKGSSRVGSPATAYNAGDHYTFTSGTPMSVALRHGEKLVFDSLPVGTTYTATQTGVANYTAQVTVVHDGGGAVASAVTAAGASVSTSAASGATLAVATNPSGAAFANVYNMDPPTGITIDNLPYLLLLLVAAAALGGHVAARTRRHARHEA
jgi:hypothetical protein